MSGVARALVLDFGGVISRTLFETHRATEAALGLPEGALTWMGPFDPAHDPLWQRMQANEISERDYWLNRTREVGALVGETWERMETFVTRARAADPDAAIRPEAVAAIEAAKRAGKKVAILSNELDLFYGPEFRARIDVLKLVDTIVDATHTKILKPAPEAYRLVTDALHVPASACVFVDDQERNVAGARAAGMTAVAFDVRSPKSSYAEALQYLGVSDA
jgi:putative hydrolase of the HAD superfamily